MDFNTKHLTCLNLLKLLSLSMLKLPHVWPEEAFQVASWVFLHKPSSLGGFTCGSLGKESTCNTGDLGSIPGLGKSPREGKGYPLQYSGLENSMDYTIHDPMSQDWATFTFTFRHMGHRTEIKARQDWARLAPGRAASRQELCQIGALSRARALPYWRPT